MQDDFLRIQSRLTDRDHVLLGWLADHGVLTSFQIAHALYPSLDFAQRRLRKLCAEDVDLLARFRPFRAEGGTWPYHYVLGQRGTEVVAVARGTELPRKDQARKRRWHLTNRANLPHLLGVNQFFTDLAGYARTHPHASLDRWWPASRFTTFAGFIEEGDSPTLMAAVPKVRPDGHGIFTEHGRSVPFFLEHDTGTEPLTTLIGKIDGYLDLAYHLGRDRPVLFWLPTALRERHLHQRLTEAGIRYPIATAARDTAAQRALSPADNLWQVYQVPGARLRLTDLANLTGTADPTSD
ncbi:replication-relaxation family protein [Actinoplanes flavus]|uniref:Replication-relaxation family protein n=1 Tax=Actinoplanes flavus TaxID=2820290 RepID=A0ABS3UJX4_9ACTN|nr:replication-relaxation family protein [Actinoplanes flavus]